MRKDGWQDLSVGIIAWASNAIVIEFISHHDGWGAFIHTGEATRYVDLTGSQDLDFTDPISRRPTRGIVPPSEASSAHETSDAIKALARLYEETMRPLHDHLRLDGLTEYRLSRGKGPRLVMAPDKNLLTAPLLGAIRAAQSHWTDALDLALIQSLNTFKFASARLSKMQYANLAEARLLSVAYAGPDPEHADYLHNADAEGRAIAQYFKSTELSAESATVGQVMSLAEAHTYLHFACHGIFVPDYPGQSGMVLADGVLTGHRIMADMKLDNARLVTLAICHGGKASPSDTADVAGVAQALLTAGAGAVISNLWPLDDDVSKTFFDRLYSALAEGQSIPTAMDRAISAVRSNPRWQHPYYWAGFTLQGLAR